MSIDLQEFYKYLGRRIGDVALTAGEGLVIVAPNTFVTMRTLKLCDDAGCLDLLAKHLDELEKITL